MEIWKEPHISSKRGTYPNPSRQSKKWERKKPRLYLERKKFKKKLRTNETACEWNYKQKHQPYEHNGHT